MIAQYIATRPIMELCLEVDQRLVLRVTNRWWDKDGMYFAGLQEASEEDRDGGGRVGSKRRTTRYGGDQVGYDKAERKWKG